MSDAAPTPALGYSVVVNLDGNRQMTMQCFVAEDEAEDVVNQKLDRAFRFIDRQKARYDIVSENEELDKEQGTLAQLSEDLARVDHDFEKAQAGLAEQLKEFDQQNKATFEAGYNEHTASGRRGEYQPKGQTKQVLAAVDAARNKVRETMDKNSAERDQHRQGVLISIERYEKAIAARQKRIAELENMLG